MGIDIHEQTAIAALITATCVKSFTVNDAIFVFFIFYTFVRTESHRIRFVGLTGTGGKNDREAIAELSKNACKKCYFLICAVLCKC